MAEPEALVRCPGCHPELRTDGEWWHPDHDLWHRVEVEVCASILAHQLAKYNDDLTPTQP